jgi:hypothetical protein
MKGFPKLTIKRILKNHKHNSRDKELQKTIETQSTDNENFEKLIAESTKQKPFDKKKK